MNPVIEVKELYFKYNSHNVINGINYSLNYSNFIGICGPNGCGKTTFLKIISGIYKNYAGSVKVFGKNIRESTNREISKIISYVPGSVFTPFDFKVFDIILMGRILYQNFLSGYSQDDFLRVYNIATDLRIESILKRNFNSLSNGEKQVVMIAQALVQETPIILLDEPTSHLDINHKIKIFNILKSKSFKKKIIVVLHDLKIAFDYCDRIIFMKDGNFRFEIKASELENNYKPISDIYSVNVESIKKYLL